MTYHFYFFVGKFPKFFNFSDSKEKNYPVELNIFKENAFYGLQKIPLDNFPRNFHISSAIVIGVCMQKVKIGHRANFRVKYKCFLQILFPVRAILRSINFRCADFKGTGKRGHIVTDTLLPTQMFPRLPARAIFVPDTKFVSGTQKMFLILFRNILCPQQMFPSLRSPRNIMSNNVSATMCPRLPVP